MSNHDFTHSASGKLVRTEAMAVGAVFLLVGLLGFVPGITTNYGSMTFAGHTSDAKLLGVFQVSILHNIVHLLFGVAGLALARRTPAAINCLIGGGVAYLVLWVYGLLVAEQPGELRALNTVDDWMHLVLGLGMIGPGVMGRSALRAGNKTDPATAEGPHVSILEAQSIVIPRCR